MSNVTPQFANSIREWVSIDDKIRAAKEVVKQLQNQKNEISEDITIYIESNGLDDQIIGIGDGKLKLATSKTSQPVNRNYIESKLTQYFKSNSEAKKIVSFLFDNRETTEKRVLKRTINRK